MVCEVFLGPPAQRAACSNNAQSSFAACLMIAKSLRFLPATSPHERPLHCLMHAELCHVLTCVRSCRSIPAPLWTLPWPEQLEVVRNNRCCTDGDIMRWSNPRSRRGGQAARATRKMGAAKRKPRTCSPLMYRRHRRFPFFTVAESCALRSSFRALCD